MSPHYHDSSLSQTTPPCTAQHLDSLTCRQLVSFSSTIPPSFLPLQSFIELFFIFKFSFDNSKTNCSEILFYKVVFIFFWEFFFSSCFKIDPSLIEFKINGRSMFIPDSLRSCMIEADVSTYLQTPSSGQVPF